MHPLPTRTGTVGELARLIGRMIGPAVSAPDGSLDAADYLALAGALADGRSTNRNLLRNAFPGEAVELLDQWEGLLGLAVSSSLADGARQERLVVVIRASAAGTPSNIGRALASINGGVAPEVLEVLAADVTAARENVFRYVVHMTTVDAAPVAGQPVSAQFSPTRWSAIKSALDRLSPAHTAAHVTTTQTTAFLTDDPNSLTDNTVLRT